MKMLYVKNKVISENNRYASTQNAWLYLLPYIILYPTDTEQGRFRKITVVEMGWRNYWI